MNQSPSEPSFPQRFAAEQAFFESLDDLDDLITGSPCQKQADQTTIISSDQESINSTWDQIEEDIEQVLHDLSDQDQSFFN